MEPLEQERNRWTLMYSGNTRTYVLTEQWLVADDSVEKKWVWGYRTQTAWKTLPEALDHITRTNAERQDVNDAS